MASSGREIEDLKKVIEDLKTENGDLKERLKKAKKEGLFCMMFLNLWYIVFLS